MQLVIPNNLLIAAVGTADATSFNTGSISPSPNRLVIITVFNAQASGTPATPSVSGLGLTWDLIRTRPSSVMPDKVRITMFRAVVPASGVASGALTVDMGGVTVTDFFYDITEFANFDATLPNGAGAILQSNDNERFDTNTGISVSLSANQNSNNAVYGVHTAVDLVGQSPGTGFTQLGFSFNMLSLWGRSNKTSVDWTWASIATKSIAMAIEIKGAAGGGAVLGLL